MIGSICIDLGVGGQYSLNNPLLDEEYIYLYIRSYLFVQCSIFTGHSSTKGGDKCNTEPLGISIKCYVLWNVISRGLCCRKELVAVPINESRCWWGSRGHIRGRRFPLFCGKFLKLGFCSKILKYTFFHISNMENRGVGMVGVPWKSWWP